MPKCIQCSCSLPGMSICVSGPLLGRTIYCSKTGTNSGTAPLSLRFSVKRCLYIRSEYVGLMQHQCLPSRKATHFPLKCTVMSCYHVFFQVECKGNWTHSTPPADILPSEPSSFCPLLLSLLSFPLISSPILSPLHSLLP